MTVIPATSAITVHSGVTASTSGGTGVAPTAVTSTSAEVMRDSSSPSRIPPGTPTAVGATPVPPLVLAVTPLWTVMALVAGIAVGLGVCGALAAAALREPLPRRPEEGLV